MADQTLQSVPGEAPEMRWYNGRFARNIRIDAPVEGGQTFAPHAHVHDEAGEEIVVVNFDGTARHGQHGRIHPDDARVLIMLGYRIRADRHVR
jgi:hypothetical protein